MGVDEGVPVGVSGDVVIVAVVDRQLGGGAGGGGGILDLLLGGGGVSLLLDRGVLLDGGGKGGGLGQVSRGRGRGGHPGGGLLSGGPDVVTLQDPEPLLAGDVLHVVGLAASSNIGVLSNPEIKDDLRDQGVKVNFRFVCTCFRKHQSPP